MNYFKNIILGGIFFTCSISQSAYPLEALSDRITDYFNAREEAALFQIYLQPDLFDSVTGLPTFDIYKSGNGDENIPGLPGSFTKGFEHDPTTGLVTAQGAASFKQLVKAMESGLQADFNAIVRAGARQLVSPQAALMFSLEGRPTQLFHGYTPAKLTSAEGAAQMIEVYLQAICRHVRFEDYGTGLNTDADGKGGSKTQQAAIILNNLGDAFKGPRDSSNGTVTPAVLFRGIGQGVDKGPYVSQFSLQNICPMSSFNLVFRKQFFPTPALREFGVTWSDFIALENGNIPRPYAYDRDFGPAHLPTNGADMTSIFHNDGPCEAFYYAAQILFENNFPPAPDLPYFNGTMPNEAAFISAGPVEVFCIMAAASQEAIQAAWAQKWLAHRNRRPEAFAGLVHVAKTTGTNPFNLHESLFNSTLLDLILEYNQRQSDPAIVPDVRDRLSLADASTYLLSQVYAESSPLHPSYTSGHAAIAGACATVLKAYFKGDALIKDHMTPVKVDPNDPTELTTVGVPGVDEMTVNSELNKLASNACLGSRNFAGTGGVY